MNISDKKRKILNNFVSEDDNTPLAEGQYIRPNDSVLINEVKSFVIDKQQILDIIKNDEFLVESMQGKRGKDGARGPKGKSPKVDDVVELLTNTLIENKSFVEMVKSDLVDTKQLVSDLMTEAKKDQMFLNSIAQMVWSPQGGGLGYEDVVKTINEVVGGVIANYTFNSIHFNTNYTQSGYPPYEEGLLFYDYGNKTHAGYDDTGEVITQYGQEVHVRVSNTTGSTFTNGTLISTVSDAISAVDGVTDGGLAIASIDNNNQIIGVATHDIANGSIGKITINGNAGGMNTSAYPKATELYLSEIVQGEFTDIKPISPYPTIKIGSVVKSHATEGIILVQIDNEPLTIDEQKTLFVAINGTDLSAVDGSRLKPYKTIEYALDQIDDASFLNRYIIHVSPGIYPENNPIQMKPYVSILGASINSTVVSATNNDVLIEVVDSTLLKTMGFFGHVSATTIDVSTSGFMALEDLAIFSGRIGLNIDNADANVVMNNLVAIGSGEELINIDAGKPTIKDVNITNLADYNCGMRCSSSATNVFCASFIDNSTNSSKSIWIRDNAIVDVREGKIIGNATPGSGTSGIYLEDCDAHILNMTIQACDCAVSVPADTDDTKISITNSVFTENTCDLHLLSPNMYLAGSVVSNSDKITINPLATSILGIADGKPGDEGYTLTGELHVGRPNAGAESCLGEGDSYTNGMIVYTSGIGEPLLDVTTQARSLTESNFGFPNVNIDSVIYIASTISATDEEPIPHYGIKHDCVSAYNGSGSVVAEYLTSAGWQNIKTMTTNGSAPYIPQGNQIFQDIGSKQLRYDGYVASDGWIKGDPISLGKQLFWVRYRISTTLNVAPQFEQFKLHSNRSEINSDGWLEYFGKARPIAKLPWTISGLQKAATNPADGDAYLSDNIDIGFKENAFNAAGLRVGFMSTLPLDMDTSSPVKLRFAVRTDGDGDFNYIIRYTYATPNSSIYTNSTDAPTTHPNEVEIVGSVSSSNDQITWFEEELDFSDSIGRRLGGFPDVIAMSIERNTGGVGGDLIMLDAEYVKWCTGGHVEV